MSIYDRRHKLLTGDEAEVAAVLSEVEALSPEVVEAIAKKRAELGDAEFTNLFRRLALQMIDTLWVEHLEVMNYTRSSVNLRAYGQRDPLVEYRKEGTRLFTEMQAIVRTRIAEIIPRLMPAVIEKEDVELKKQAAAALRSSEGKGDSSAPKAAPRVAEAMPGRNDIVTITNGTETREVKFKKAEPLLGSGWQLK